MCTWGHHNLPHSDRFRWRKTLRIGLIMPSRVAEVGLNDAFGIEFGSDRVEAS